VTLFSNDEYLGDLKNQSNIRLIELKYLFKLTYLLCHKVLDDLSPNGALLGEHSSILSLEVCKKGPKIFKLWKLLKTTYTKAF
jgi:hypothetical protein